MSTRHARPRLAGRTGGKTLHFADAFCFLQLNYSSRHKKMTPTSLPPPHRLCLSPLLPRLSEPNAFSWPRFASTCPPRLPVPVSFSAYFGNPYIFISYLNVFQLPLSDLPINHHVPHTPRPPPAPSPRYFFYLSLFLIFIRLSPVCLTRASFHFISFDDNLSFPIHQPRPHPPTILSHPLSIPPAGPLPSVVPLQ